jgi:hypothetical protein
MAGLEKINCRVCKYYYITWDRSFPNGCKAYGIKSKEMPTMIVYKSSGQNCKLYGGKEG